MFSMFFVRVLARSKNKLLHVIRRRKVFDLSFAAECITMEHNTNHNNKFGGFEQVFQSLLKDLISKANREDDAVIGNITKKNCMHLLEEEEPVVIDVSAILARSALKKSI